MSQSKVTHFHAGWNLPGYLPDSPYLIFFDEGEAEQYIVAEYEDYLTTYGAEPPYAYDIIVCADMECLPTAEW